MSARIVLYPTFDYELFLGRNFGSDEEVLFGPTDRLLEECARIGVSITLFADVCSVWAHERAGRGAYVERFRNQLAAAASAGHDVQLHVHPHWLFAKPARDARNWDLDSRRMYLSELGFGDGPDEAPAVLRRGVEWLEQLLRPVRPDYRCIAFRAAGLALQPREGELLRALAAAGITTDSSVAKDLRTTTDTVQIDYTNMPSSPTWRMSPEAGIATSAEAGIEELPIATFQLDAPTRARFLVRRATSVGRMRGLGISRGEQQGRLAGLRALVAGNLRYLTSSPTFLLSCDTKGLDLRMLLRGVEAYVASHSGHEVVPMAAIGHPKLMFGPELALFRALILGLRARYSTRFETSTFTAAARRRGA